MLKSQSQILKPGLAVSLLPFYTPYSYECPRCSYSGKQLTIEESGAKNVEFKRNSWRGMVPGKWLWPTDKLSFVCLLYVVVQFYPWFTFNIMMSLKLKGSNRILNPRMKKWYPFRAKAIKKTNKEWPHGTEAFYKMLKGHWRARAAEH